MNEYNKFLVEKLILILDSEEQTDFVLELKQSILECYSKVGEKNDQD